MNIWIDITNSPHVIFFKQMIEDLKKKHDIILTCRSLANTIDLLDIYGFPYEVVGKHYGSNKVMKVMGLFLRIMQLVAFLRDKNIDVAISHSSFSSPPVSHILGVPSVYLNDNEYAEGNRISFLFANVIMIPEFLDPLKVKRQWAKSEKVVSYPGVKEGVYLWPYENLVPNSQCKAGQSSMKTIFVRPEPWTAQYYKGDRYFIDDLIVSLKQRHNIILLPRGEKQKRHYLHSRFDGITVPEKSMALSEIMRECDLFIGAGGTMTREAAVLGIPTISVYQDNLLDVDRYLIEKGYMVHKKHLTKDFVEYFLQENDRCPARRELLDKGKKAYTMIVNTLLNIRK